MLYFIHDAITGSDFICNGLEFCPGEDGNFCAFYNNKFIGVFTNKTFTESDDYLNDNRNNLNVIFLTAASISLDKTQL